MRVAAVKIDYKGCPKAIEELGFSSESVTHLSVNKEYTVWAISRWKGVFFLQVIDDNGYPSWLPFWLFSMRDGFIPRNWVCSIFEDELEIILGPKFLAENYEAYEAMVELQPFSVQQFWENVNEADSDGCDHG
jgi:hypothetical protein